MDGTVWFGHADAEAVAEKRAERRALRDAMLMTVASIVVAVSVVLGLAAAHVNLPVAEEFVSAPIGQ